MNGRFNRSNLSNLHFYEGLACYKLLYNTNYFLVKSLEMEFTKFKFFETVLEMDNKFKVVFTPSKLPKFDIGWTIYSVHIKFSKGKKICSIRANTP